MMKHTGKLCNDKKHSIIIELENLKDNDVKVMMKEVVVMHGWQRQKWCLRYGQNFI